MSKVWCLASVQMGISLELLQNQKPNSCQSRADLPAHTLLYSQHSLTPTGESRLVPWLLYTLELMVIVMAHASGLAAACACHQQGAAVGGCASPGPWSLAPASTLQAAQGLPPLPPAAAPCPRAPSARCRLAAKGRHPRTLHFLTACSKTAPSICGMLKER